MRRYISGDGSGANPGLNLTQGVMTAVASGAIGQGELTILTEAGTFRRADPALPLSALNNTTVGPSPIYPPTAIAPADGRLGVPVRLLGGNVIVPALYVALSPNYPGCYVRSAAGTAITTITLPITPNFGASPAQPPQAVALTDGNFALAYLDASSVIKVGIYTPGGNLVTTISGTAGAINVGALKGNLFALVALTGGGFALAYQRGTKACARTFTNAGVGGTELVTSLISGDRYIAAACKNGDFLFGASNGLNTQSLFRVSANGTLVFGPVVVNGAPLDPPQTPNPRGVLTELPNGKIAWVTKDASNVSIITYFSASGAVMATVPLGSGGNMDGAKAMPLVVTPYGLAVIGVPANSGGTYLSIYDFDGNVMFKERLVDTGGTTTTPGSLDAAWTGTGVAVLRATLTDQRLFVTDLNGGPLGAPVSTNVGNETASIIAQDSGLAYLATGTALALYKCARTAIAGIAQTGAADGDTTTVFALGSYPIPAKQTFPVTGNFDGRAAAVPGPRGFLGGNRVFLFGFGSLSV